MTEQGSHYSGIGKVIETLKTGERPIDANVASSLEELYLSGKYRYAILSGADRDIPRVLQAIRTITIGDNDLLSRVISISVSGKNDNGRLLDLIKQALNRIPLSPEHLAAFRVLENAALSSLRREGLSTVAGLAISTDPKTGREIAEAYYPKSFMQVLPVPVNFQSDLGLGMATYFLRKVPFSSGRINITLPSH